MSNAGVGESHSGWNTSLGLLAGIQANESAAWTRFAELYGTLFDHWFRFASIPETDWADLRQEVFLAVARGLPGYQHSPAQGSFRGWLRVIVRNKVIDRGRQWLPLPLSPVLEQQLAPDSGAYETPDEYRVLFRRALDLVRTDFEPSTWQAFWLMAVEDRTAAEAAAQLGLTLNAVYLAKARVVRRLREEFGDFLHDSPPK